MNEWIQIEFVRVGFARCRKRFQTDPLGVFARYYTTTIYLPYRWVRFYLICFFYEFQSRPGDPANPIRVAISSKLVHILLQMVGHEPESMPVFQRNSCFFKNLTHYLVKGFSGLGRSHRGHFFFRQKTNTSASLYCTMWCSWGTFPFLDLVHVNRFVSPKVR